MSVSSVTFHPASPSVVRFGPFRFDRANRLLSRDGIELTVPPRALGVLEFLVDRRDKVVTKQALIDSVWNGTIVSETSLTEAISLLRQTLEDDSQAPKYIQTLHRRGYRFIAPVTFEQEAALRAAPAPLLEDAARIPRSRVLIISGAVLILALLGLIFLLDGGHDVVTSTPRPVQLSISLPAGTELGLYAPSVAMSPDGQVVVFAALHEGAKHLFRRSMESREASRIEGTKDGMGPFFSPDGHAVAFLADGKLKSVTLDGGHIQVLYETPKGVSGSWADDGSIVMSADIPSGLIRIREDGVVEKLTQPDASRGEVGHLWPVVLPGSKSVLFTSWSNNLTSATIDILSLETKKRRTVLRGASYPLYSRTGHLLFATQSGLMAAPFDAKRGVLTGSPKTITTQTLTFPFTGNAQAAISEHGGLVTISGSLDSMARELVWFTPNGKDELIAAPPRLYRNAKISPDRTRLAVTALENGRSDIWIVNLADGGLTRLTFDAYNIEPVWSPDGQWVAFASNRSGPYNMYEKRASGEEDLRPLNPSDRHQYPLSWSAADNTIVYSEAGTDTGLDLWMLRRGAVVTRVPFRVTEGQEFHAEFSPAGRWIAYSSNESGPWQVYLRDLAGEGKWQVSLDGGYSPFWSADGGTVYYQNEDEVLAVSLDRSGPVQIGKPKLVTRRTDVAHLHTGTGDRLIMIREREKRPQPTHLDVILNWPALVTSD